MFPLSSATVWQVLYSLYPLYSPRELYEAYTFILFIWQVRVQKASHTAHRVQNQNSYSGLTVEHLLQPSYTTTPTLNSATLLVGEKKKKMESENRGLDHQSPGL